MDKAKLKAKQLFDYDAHTGELRWRVDRVVSLRNHLSVKAKAGAIAGWCNDSGYRIVLFEGKRRRATALIWLLVYGRWPTKEIDHINGNRSDDRICNLREATPRQNRYNSKLRVNNKSGYKGVCWSVQKAAWRSTIKVDGKQKHLGFYKQPEEAYQAYVDAALRFHGEFARLK